MLYKSSENWHSKGIPSVLWSEVLTGQSLVQLQKGMVPAPKGFQSVCTTSEDRWMQGAFAWLQEQSEQTPNY